MGGAEMFLGPMFSEKTTEVISRLNRARLGRLPCLFIKFAGDNRYGSGPVVRTHGGMEAKSEASRPDMAPLRVVEARELGAVEVRADEAVIGVDEGQFYSDLPEAVDRWIREGKQVYIAALDGDSRRQPFGRVHETIPFASRVQKFNAVCMLCPPGTTPRDAPYTARIVDNAEQILIGGKQQYAAACVECYHRHQN